MAGQSNSQRCLLIVVLVRIVFLLVISLTLSACTAVAQSIASPPEKNTQSNEAPRRLTISVSVTDPDDLKVSEGDRIAVGQLIADRTRDRNRLEAQARQLTLTLQRLEQFTITPPLPPATPPLTTLRPTWTRPRR